MKRIYKTIILAGAVLVSSGMMAQTQDEVVRAQFVAAETAGAALGANRWDATEYYQLLHKNYQNSCYATNKLMYRELMREKLYKEEKYAENIDSALTERSREELIKISDRQPVIDVVGNMEVRKIEDKLSLFNKNINRITVEGGTVGEYRTWYERYNAINCGLQAVKSAYMPNGERTEQYHAIYKDVVRQNTELVNYIMYLRSLKLAKKQKKANAYTGIAVGSIAQNAHRAWMNTLASASGLGSVHQQTSEEKLEEIKDNN